MNKKLFLLSLIFVSAVALEANAFDAGAKFKAVCLTCHTVGGGDKIGPDLKGVTKRRKMDWIVKFVQYPEGMIKGDPEEPGYEKPDPVAVELFKKYKSLMTEQDLTEEEIKAMMTWIDAQKEPVK